MSDSITFPLLFFSPGQLFEEQSCPEPERGIIQADDSVDICFGIAVVPGAHPPFLQEASCQEFYKKDEYCVADAADDDTVIFQPSKQRCEEGCQAIYGEHPKGGLAFELHFAAAE